ncbi:MAG TPA: glycogen synthase GlgA [Candidatus Acidoferrales bacterium]|nr:glycogen synthase GlgA [Candidatus Acidoferrales bacterium]
MRILFVASEGLPFSKTGGLADVVEALPKALVEAGHEVAVVLPRYRGTKATTVVVPSMTIPDGRGLRFPAISDGTILAGVRYFFVDDPEYFDREQLYGVKGVDYPDNALRFGEFSRAAIEIAKNVWPADVIHCHDWQSALVPVLLRTLYAADPLVSGLPVVFTIHNMGYHGLFSRDTLAELGLPESLFRIEAMEFFGHINLLKGGLVYSDYLTTVSRKYAQEIQTEEFGHGLDGVVRDRSSRLRGILNGVDYSIWSPENDPLIACQYSAKDLTGKKACKKDLLEQFKLDANDLQRPLIGIVSRFAAQKGFDLIEEIAGELVRENVSIVALGAGEPRYEALFRELAGKYPRQVGVKVAYDNTLAHKIEAGSDMFLMPSRYEPCGLNQIYSLRYGTVPIVRATGGLDDTIEPFDPASGRGTGFKFEKYDAKDLMACIRKALTSFKSAPVWQRLQANGMARDFSWRASAGEYAQLYEAARKARILNVGVTSNSM